MAEQRSVNRPGGDMRRLVQRAFDAGAHVSVLLRGQPDSRFSGQVLDVGEEAFSLTHLGEGVAWRWSFNFDDVSALGLRLPLLTDPGLAPGCPRHDHP
ncbi:MAG: hypothetical protein VKQ33_04475 [Candidatus Sericytochromatia bacterium]|nr:hypothetical protein [Candidatus Sericytochromatia bacterium]